MELRFWAKVDRTGGPDACWVWTAARDNLGYGFFRAQAQRNMQKAHRVSWTLAHGDVPTGWHVCHRCDNPSCVNPAHLFLGSHQDNMQDRNVKGRTTKGRPFALRGELSPKSKLTAAQVADIRRRYAAGGVCQRELAAEYGVSQTEVGRIVRGARWVA